MLSNPWFQNVTSNFITLLIIVVAGWLVHRLTTRVRLLTFCGVKDRKRVLLYLSSVRVMPGGSVGVDGQPRSYEDTAIPENEARLIPLFQRLFNFLVPGFESQPGRLKWLTMSDVAVDAVPSPPDDGDVERSSSFIAVGSPAYNSASLHIERAFTPIARFKSDYSGFVLQNVPDIIDTRCCFVQRVFDQTSNQTAFYVAGMSALGTTGAAYYLAAEWRHLSKKYPHSRPFCVVLRIVSDDAHMYQVLFEKG
jgi:hypothetical protein